MWKLIFDSSGVANRILGREILWLADTGASFWAIVIADTWKTAAFIGLLTLAGLQTIPAEVYEAAKVDGATTWQQFVRITLPMVKPTLVVAVLFRTLDTLRMFDLPYGMIGPGKYRVETCRSSPTRKQPRRTTVRCGVRHYLVPVRAPCGLRLRQDPRGRCDR